MVFNLMRAAGALAFIMGCAYSGGHYQAFTFELTTILGFNWTLMRLNWTAKGRLLSSQVNY